MSESNLLMWRESTTDSGDGTGENDDSSGSHQPKPLNSHQNGVMTQPDYLSWMESSTCPRFFNANPKVEKLGLLEYKFWLGMVDPKYGWIRHFGKSKVEKNEIEEKAEDMTNKMDEFRSV